MSTGDIRFTRMITLANGRASRFSVRVAYTHLDVEVASSGSVRNENGPKGVAGHETPPGLITGGPRGHRRAPVGGCEASRRSRRRAVRSGPIRSRPKSGLILRYVEEGITFVSCAWGRRSFCEFIHESGGRMRPCKHVEKFFRRGPSRMP